MRRVAAIAVALPLACAATAAAAAGGADVRVSPLRGGVHRTFVVGFTAPARSGPDGAVVRGYAVDVRTDAKRCGGTVGLTRSATARAAGQRVRVVLDAKRPARWCRGRYSGDVTMYEAPNCAAGEPCPASPTRLTTLGRFRFRVR